MADRQQLPEQPGGSRMARREFIRKSLMLSGAAFVGMSSLNRTGVPSLNAKAMPVRSASNHARGGGNGRERGGDGGSEQGSE